MEREKGPRGKGSAVLKRSLNSKQFQSKSNGGVSSWELKTDSRAKSQQQGDGSEEERGGKPAVLKSKSRRGAFNTGSQANGNGRGMKTQAVARGHRRGQTLP